MNVPFLNLAANTPLKNEIFQAVEKVLTGGHYILGPNVAEFEKEVAAFTEQHSASG